MACVKSRRMDPSNWAELHPTMLDFIFEYLSFKDLLRAEAVCSHWLSVAKSHITFKFQILSEQPPCLLPHPPQDSEDDNVVEGCCIGSSHGWLIFLDERGSPFLINPIIQVMIELPPIHSLMGILEIQKNKSGGEEGEYCVKYRSDKNPVSYMKNLRENLIHKCVLSSDPCFSINNFGVVLIYGREAKLAYYNKHGESSSWTELDGKHQPYQDIICNKNHLYALGSNASVEVWELSDGHIPIKRMEIGLAFPEKSLKLWREFGDLYSLRFYLVEVSGEILLVLRFIGEYVNGNDEAVREEDLLTDEDTHPLVCPYRTLAFHVYKLDFHQKKWVEINSLGDHAVFLGGNHSISAAFQSCQKNSIYFTDDYWDRMNEDYLYGGHDMGVLFLENQSFERFCGSSKIHPPPCWVARSAW